MVFNVPGPRKPVYCAGAQTQHYFPLSLPYHGCALNITVHHFLDQLDFGLIACAGPCLTSSRSPITSSRRLQGHGRRAGRAEPSDAIESYDVARPRVLLTHATGEPHSSERGRGRKATGEVIEGGPEMRWAPSDESRRARSRPSANATGSEERL